MTSADPDPPAKQAGEAALMDTDQIEPKTAVADPISPDLKTLIYQFKACMMTDPRSFGAIDSFRAVLRGAAQLESKVKTLEKEVLVIPELKNTVKVLKYELADVKAQAKSKGVTIIHRPYVLPQNVNLGPTTSLNLFNRLPAEIRDHIWKYVIKGARIRVVNGDKRVFEPSRDYRSVAAVCRQSRRVAQNARWVAEKYRKLE